MLRFRCDPNPELCFKFFGLPRLTISLNVIGPWVHIDSDDTITNYVFMLAKGRNDAADAEMWQLVLSRLCITLTIKEINAENMRKKQVLELDDLIFNPDHSNDGGQDIAGDSASS